MYYHNITHDDLKNGDGVRVVLWVSGCEHHCKECQNPQTWSYDSGIPFDDDALKEILGELKKDYVSGITFSGGDPLAPQNVLGVRMVLDYVKLNFPHKTVWVYTGYTFEQLMKMGEHDHDYLCAIQNIDVLVDGEYKKDLRDIDLKWRGSSNQRVIDVPKTLREGKVILYCD